MHASDGIPGDQCWMRRALGQGLRSCGVTWPNPGVGCTIVRDGRIIGEGRHRRCGGPHAEIEALTDCHQRGHDPAGATVLVTLAPCTRFGRTPPCVQALIEARPARVVAAFADPGQDDPAPFLASAGISYQVGCLGHLARHLHGGFLARVTRGRPRVTGKWAMTLDGFLASASGQSRWISSPEALAYARRRRRLFDAILIGVGTAAVDDPRLTASEGWGRTPLRVVVSSGAHLDPVGRLASTARQIPVLVVHAPGADTGGLQAAGVRCLAVTDPHDPGLLLNALGAYGLNDLLVEGGAAVHGAFLKAGAYDRLEVYIGDRSLAGGHPVACAVGAARIDLGGAWELETAPRVLGSTVCCRYHRQPHGAAC